MSLLKRVERAQRGPGDPNDRAVVPVAPAQPAQTRGPGRGEQIGDIRLRLQGEVIASFTDLIDAKPEEVTAKIEGIVDRVITEGLQRVPDSSKLERSRPNSASRSAMNSSYSRRACCIPASEASPSARGWWPLAGTFRSSSKSPTNCRLAL